MATYLIDLDGTILHHGSNVPLEGAIDLLKGLVDVGHEIIFLTRRGDKEFKGHSVYSKEGAIAAVAALGVPYKDLIFDVSSPRIVVNDEGAYAHRHQVNTSWNSSEVDSLARLGFAK